MRHRPLFLMFIFFIITISSCLAASDRLYLEFGHDRAGASAGSWFADYDSTNYIEINLTIGNRLTQDGESPVVVGDVDGDGIQEMVYADITGLHIYYYDQDADNYFEEYTDGTMRAHTPITLFDGDDDGRLEMYFCGNTTTNINSSFFAYQVNSSDDLERVWERQVADGSTAPDTHAGMGCYHTDVAAGHTVASADAVYTPECITMQNGTSVCLFVGGCDVAPCTNRHQGRPTFYRFNTLDGGEMKYNPTTVVTTGIRSNGGYNADLYAWASASSTTSAINGNRNNVKSPVCNIDTADAESEWIIPFSAYNAGVNVDLFYYMINIETMTANTNFDTDGVYMLNADHTDIYSSPSCYNNGIDVELYYVGEVASGASIYKLDGEANEDGLVNSDLNAMARTSNIVFGRFNDDLDISAGAIIKDTGSGNVEFMSGEATGGAFINVVNDALGSLSSSALPCVATTEITEGGTGPSNLAGDLNADIMTNYGLWMVDPDTETLSLATYTYPEDTACFTPSDFNSDGFTDFIGIKDNLIHFIRANTTSINEVPDLKRIIPDVSGRVMCTGNQTFLLESPTTGYTDAENNNVRLHYRCNSTGSFNDTEFAAYGTNFTITCPYNSSGGTFSFIAKICLQDNIHPNDVTQCVNVETIVADVAGCEDADLSFDVGDAVVDDEEVTDDEDAEGEERLIDDAISTIEGLYATFGADEQDERDFISMIFIIFIFIILAAGIPSHGWLAGLITSVLLTAILSFTSVSTGGSLLSPVFLMIAIVLALVILFLIAPAIKNRGD